jgi:hypothetical protein
MFEYQLISALNEELQSLIAYFKIEVAQSSLSFSDDLQF